MPSEQTILLVEDDLLDIYLMKRIFEKLKIMTPLVVAKNGGEAMDILKKAMESSKQEKHSLPSLILLDVKLPAISGLEVLRWIRGETALADLPVVMFSSSSEPRDVRTANEYGANGYFLKTGSLTTMQQLVAFWRDHWLLRNGAVGLESLDLLKSRDLDFPS